jgi:hypothetical protein
MLTRTTVGSSRPPTRGGARSGAGFVAGRCGYVERAAGTRSARKGFGAASGVSGGAVTAGGVAWTVGWRGTARMTGCAAVAPTDRVAPSVATASSVHGVARRADIAAMSAAVASGAGPDRPLRRSARPGGGGAVTDVHGGNDPADDEVPGAEASGVELSGAGTPGIDASDGETPAPDTSGTGAGPLDSPITGRAAGVLSGTRSGIGMAPPPTPGCGRAPESRAERAGGALTTGPATWSGPVSAGTGDGRSGPEVGKETDRSTPSTNSPDPIGSNSDGTRGRSAPGAAEPTARSASRRRYPLVMS